MKLWQRLIVWLFWVSVFAYACVVIKHSTDVNVGFGHERTGKGGLEVDINKKDTVLVDSTLHR